MSTAVASLIGIVVSGLVSLGVASMQHNKSMALIEYRLKELEDKVDKHNNLVERMYKVESQLDVVKARN